METQPDPSPDSGDEKKPSAIEFVKAKLSLNPEASFAEIKAQAKCEGVVIYPVVYGRAKALLGLVPTAPYGSKSKIRRERSEAVAAEVAAPEPVAPPPPKQASRRVARAQALPSGEGLDSLEAMIEDLKNAVRERDRYRTVLLKIADLIRDELDA